MGRTLSRASPQSEPLRNCDSTGSIPFQHRTKYDCCRNPLRVYRHRGKVGKGLEAWVSAASSTLSLVRRTPELRAQTIL